MPRKLTIIPHLSSTELKERYQTSHDPVESRRWHLLWLVSEHHTLTAAAEAIGLNYDYARRIVRTYNAEGVASVRNRRPTNPAHC
ncbi:MAG: helix-turn-helix domain-containing protein [Cyanobacteria bacterium P01_B01_bin.77]